MKNPLEKPGEPFELEMMNPNPTSGKNKDGAWYKVQFEVNQEDWQNFMDTNTKGMIVLAQCTVYADQDEHGAPKASKKGEWGKEAQQLRQSGFFRMPKVWEAIGTDQDFLDWLKTQKCAAVKLKLDTPMGCTGQVVPAHVRRVSDGAGTGIKPPFSAIPLCHGHHAEQHQHGETALGGREWFDKMRIQYVERWAWERLKEILKAESFSQVEPLTVFLWAKNHNIDEYLPKDYKL